MFLARRKFMGPAGLVVMALAACVVHGGEVHKWIDEHGRVHYGNRPPQDVESKTVDVPGATHVDRSMIVGTWVERDVETRVVMHITYRDDGTFAGSAVEEGWGKITFSGKWSLDGNRMTWQVQRSEPTIPGRFYEPRLMTIAKVTETELVDGRGGRMQRVGGSKSAVRQGQ